MGDAYSQLIAFLGQHGAQYRLIDHAPEGRTEIVSPMRGNALSQAAKCIILMVKIGKKVTKYVLAVVPGDARVDLNAVKALIGGTYVSFASPDIAERLGGERCRHYLAFLPQSRTGIDRRSITSGKRRDIFQCGALGSLNGAEDE